MASSAPRRRRDLSSLVDGPEVLWRWPDRPTPLIDVNPSEDPANPRYTKDRCHAVAVAVSELCQSYSYTLTYEDAMSIATNPRLFDRQNLTKEKAIEGFYIQRVYNALFLKSPPTVEYPKDLKRKMQDLAKEEVQAMKETIQREHEEAEEARGSKGKGKQTTKGPKYEATRDEKARNDASDRDGHKCAWQKTPNHEMAHLFSFAATKTPEAVIKTTNCFVVTIFAFGEPFFDLWLPHVSRLGGFEFLWNLLGLNVQLHNWLDMGFLGFRFLPDSQRQDGNKWYASIVFYWLPYCPPPPPPSPSPETDRSAPATLDGGADDSVRHLFRLVDRAETDLFPPRHPEHGDGVYKLFYQDGHEVLSGHSIEIAHDTEQARDSFVTMLYLEWLGMTGLTFWGVTKGREAPAAPGGGGGGSRRKPPALSTSTALTTRPPPAAPPGDPSRGSRRTASRSPATPKSPEGWSFSRAPRMLGGPAPQHPPQPDNAQRGRGGAQRGRGDPQRGRSDPQRGRGGGTGSG